MSQEKRFSDEFLNAFVDNQIAAEEKSRTYTEIGKDETLNRQICELRKLHDLVRLAYREPPAVPTRTATHLNSRQAWLRFGVAASILLTLGIFLGSQIRMPTTTGPVAAAPADAIQKTVKTASPVKPAQPKMPAKTHIADRMASQQPAALIPATGTPAIPAPAIALNERLDNATTKVLIHLARDDSEELRQALDDIEGTLNYYRKTGERARVEVVVNGKGLELVRTDTSEFAGRILHLQREFDNLTFAACQNTIDRLTREQGVTVRLLPGVITIDSGMAEIMRRQNQGWTYLRV